MTKGAKFKKYLGHSSHVTNVRWMAGDELLVSAGGADTAVMIWQRGGADKTCARGDSDDSDTDSEDEGGEMFNEL